MKLINNYCYVKNRPQRLFEGVCPRKLMSSWLLCARSEVRTAPPGPRFRRYRRYRRYRRCAFGGPFSSTPHADAATCLCSKSVAALSRVHFQASLTQMRPLRCALLSMMRSLRFDFGPSKPHFLFSSIYTNSRSSAPGG